LVWIVHGLGFRLRTSATCRLMATAEQRGLRCRTFYTHWRRRETENLRRDRAPQPVRGTGCRKNRR
jgi:hypothetical protein